MKVKFWGVRGSLPTPGPKTARYGGNTTCCVVRYSWLNKEKGTTVLDLGSGIRNFGKEILPEMFRRKGMHIDFLMSHVHWDHIQGFPFFAPIFIPHEKLPFNDFIFYGGPQNPNLDPETSDAVLVSIMSSNSPICW